MSKDNGKALAAVPAGFAVEMPDHAPALGFDPAAPGFSWREVMPSNYWSIDELEERKRQLGGWPVLTAARVVIKPVYDPAEYDGKAPPAEELRPKIVLEFAESAPALVLNKSRCQQVTELTGTPNPALWAERLGAVALEVGLLNKRAQILLAPAPDDDPENW